MTDVPVCYRHPDRPTRLSCSVCERPICPDCSFDASVGQRCPECHRSIGTTQVSRMRDLNRLSGAPVTRALLVLIVVGYLAQRTLGSNFVDALWQDQGTFTDNQLWRLLTTAFLHGGLFHLALNGYGLWALGPPIERQIGSSGFLGLWIVSAVGGGVAVGLLSGGMPVVGASGALFGLFGYFLVLGWRNRKTRQGREILNQFGYLLVINAAAPLLFPIISWQGHLGGLLTGMILTSAWAQSGAKSKTAKTIQAAVLGAVLLATAAIL